MTISIFVDPGFEPPPVLPALPPVKLNQPEPSFPLDREIVNFMRDQSEPISAWTLANGVAAALNPPNRNARRELKLQILGRITRMIHTGYVRRVGKYLTIR